MSTTRPPRTPAQPDLIDWRLPLLVIAPTPAIARDWAMFDMRLHASRWRAATEFRDVRGCYQRAGVLIAKPDGPLLSREVLEMAERSVGLTLIGPNDRNAMAPYRCSVEEWQQGLLEMRGH